MRSSITYFLLGFLSALILIITIYYYFDRSNNETYFILDKDYEISNIGVLRKGAKIKFDKGMDEGFSRYILYLNIKGENFEKDKTETYDIVPYWLNEIDSSLNATH